MNNEQYIFTLACRSCHHEYESTDRYQPCQHCGNDFPEVLDDEDWWEDVPYEPPGDRYNSSDWVE